MSSTTITPSAGRALTPGAVALMLMLCLSWGFNQIAVKLVLPDVPPMLQALVRSSGALPVLLLIGWLRGVKFFERDGTLWAGMTAGVIFGIEFVLIFRGLVLGRAHHPYPKPVVAVAARLSVVLGGRADVHLVVRAGKGLFGQQALSVHFHHAAVRRGRELFHPARQADARFRRGCGAGD